MTTVRVEARLQLTSTASRTDVLMAAIRHEIESRRQHLDSADDIGSVCLEVKLAAGTTFVRGVVYQEERVCRRT